MPRDLLFPPEVEPPNLLYNTAARTVALTSSGYRRLVTAGSLVLPLYSHTRFPPSPTLFLACGRHDAGLHFCEFVFSRMLYKCSHAVNDLWVGVGSSLSATLDFRPGCRIYPAFLDCRGAARAGSGRYTCRSPAFVY